MDVLDRTPVLVGAESRHSCTTGSLAFRRLYNLQLIDLQVTVRLLSLELLRIYREHLNRFHEQRDTAELLPNRWANTAHKLNNILTFLKTWNDMLQLCSRSHCIWKDNGDERCYGMTVERLGGCDLFKNWMAIHTGIHSPCHW